MKIVFASTQDQEEKINELILSIYEDIFPLYFARNEIEFLKKTKVLHASPDYYERLGTLKEAYNVIASLQTLIYILQLSDSLPQYEIIYYQNVQILQNHGLSFPFKYDQFDMKRSKSKGVYSSNIKPANELPI